MSHHYSDPSREHDPDALPDIEVFEMTAQEAASLDEDLIYEYSKRNAHRLCFMNSRARDQMLDAIVKEHAITGGWFYWYCFPGCLPDSSPIGPFDTYDAALAAARTEQE